MCLLVDFIASKLRSRSTRTSQRHVRLSRVQTSKSLGYNTPPSVESCYDDTNEPHSGKSASPFCSWLGDCKSSLDSETAPYLESDTHPSLEMQNAHDPHSTRHGPYPYWNPCPLSAPGWIHTSTPAQYQPFALPSHLYQPPTAQACPPAYPYPHFASAPTYYPAFVTPFQAPVPLTASYPQAATNPAAASSMSSQAFVPVITYFPPLATISVPCPLRDPSVTPVWPPEQVQASLMNLHDPSIHALSQPLVVPQKFEGGTFPPQPLGGLVPIRIHAQLVLNPIDINDPILQWDIVQHPDISRALSPRRVMLPVAMNSLAVTPGSRNLYITSDWDFLQYWMDPKRWGPVILQQGTDVTVQDLLEAIHAYFQQPLTEGEEEEIKAQAGGREKLKDAWRQRVQDSYEALPAISAQYGYVRSDVLGRFRRWQGLRAVVFANGSWKLYLRLLPGPAPDLVI